MDRDRFGASAGRALLLVAAGIACEAWAAPPKDNGPCPDIAGHYWVDPSGEMFVDAINALGLGRGLFRGAEVRFASRGGTGYDLFVKPASGTPMSPVAAVTLTHGVDYVCRDGWIELTKAVPASRKRERGFYEGTATVRLRKGNLSGLALAARFTGGERTTIYQYDSARISVPRMGTNVRSEGAIRWPDISEPPPPVPVERQPEAPEAPAVLEARRRLTHPVVGPIVLGPFTAQADGVQAIFNASRSEEVAMFEERLRQAGIGYVVKQQPVWSNSGWRMVFLLPPPEKVVPWRPTRLWVEAELKRTRHPYADIDEVRADPQGYVVSLTLSGDARLADVALRTRKLSSAFAEVAVLDDPLPTGPAGSAGAAGRRRGQLLLVMP